MRLDYNHIIHFFFPPSENEQIIHTTTKEQFLSHFYPTTYRGITSLSAYREPAIRAAIGLNKFNAHRKSTRLLAALLDNYLTQQPQTLHLLPIPLAKKRERVRGYNQVTEILRQCRAPMHTLPKKTLIRTTNTTPQTSLTRSARLYNMKGVFAVHARSKEDLAGKHILILDDVSTTGATLHAAEGALLPHSPASITLLALAH